VHTVALPVRFALRSNYLNIFPLCLYPMHIASCVCARALARPRVRDYQWLTAFRCVFGIVRLPAQGLVSLEPLCKFCVCVVSHSENSAASPLSSPTPVGVFVCVAFVGFCFRVASFLSPLSVCRFVAVCLALCIRVFAAFVVNARCGTGIVLLSFRLRARVPTLTRVVL
jgi:hypothetical protein